MSTYKRVASYIRDKELEPLTHEQVVKMAHRTKPKLIQPVKSIVEQVKLG